MIRGRVDDEDVGMHPTTVPASTAATTRMRMRMMPGVFYSRAKMDRSGAAIQDMLLAHAYAFRHNRTYGGACFVQRQDTTNASLSVINNNVTKNAIDTRKRLIQTLGLSDILPFECPPSPPPSPSSSTNVDSTVTSTPQSKMHYHDVDDDDDDDHEDDMSWKILDPFEYGRYRTELWTREWLGLIRRISRTSRRRHGRGNVDVDDAVVGDDDVNTTREKDASTIPQIVIHIRRGDVSPCLDDGARYLPNQHYLEILKTLNHDDDDDDPKAASSSSAVRERKKKTKKKAMEKDHVVIFSESRSHETWKDDFDGYDLRLDTPLEEAWNAMIMAETLILSKSSFSYVPAILNERHVIYTPFWYKPLPSWKVIDPNLVREATRQVQRMRHEHCTT